ncbi:hypothetical protein HYT56_05715 [Candidatus Woesearchaeota archaeon]|nr:hypothetical protein [Candidatus Woesearchaeota archaeon]
MSEQSLQEKVNGVYNRVKSDFYLCRPDLMVSGREYNSHLLLGLLTQLNNGTQLIYGAYGGGKTSSSLYLNSILYGLPLNTVRSAVVRGNPGITEEKAIARPDYGALNKGEEQVRWQKFCLIPPKIWDELPRTPEGRQAVALAGIEEGSWAYLNEHIFEGRRPFYATANFRDRGSYSIIPALLDRFDIATVVGFPGLVNSRIISRRYNKNQEALLGDESLEDEAEKVLLSRENYETIQEGMIDIRGRFLEVLKERGFPILTNEDRLQINKEISKVELSSQAEAYCTFLTAELNIPVNGNYLRNLTSECTESRRLDQVLVRYAQSLAWLQDRNEATLEDVSAIAPYALWHRIEWKDGVKGRFADYSGNDRDLIIAKLMLGEGGKGIEGLKRRLINSSGSIEELRKHLESGNEEEAKKLLDEITKTDKTHPYFLDVKRELEGFIA